MMKKKRKVEELKVDAIDWIRSEDMYKEEYRGKVISDSTQTQYCSLDGKIMTMLSAELTKLVLGQEVTILSVVEADVADTAIQVAQESGNTSLIDSIGAKPTKINIEF